MSKHDEAIRLRQQMREQRQTLRGLNHRLARVETENVKLRRDRRDIVAYVDTVLARIDTEMASGIIRDVAQSMLQPLQAALAAGSFPSAPAHPATPRNPPSTARLQAECRHPFLECYLPPTPGRDNSMWKCTDCGQYGLKPRADQ